MNKEFFMIFGIYILLLIVFVSSSLVCIRLVVDEIPEYDYNITITDGTVEIIEGHHYKVNGNGDLTIYDMFIFPVKTYLTGLYTEIKVVEKE